MLLLKMRATEASNHFRGVIMTALTIQTSRDFLPSPVRDLSQSNRPVKLTIVSAEQPFLQAVANGIALADSKFRAAAERPNNLGKWVGFSLLLHLLVVWGVTHRSEPDVAPIIPEMVVEFVHPQQNQPQVATVQPPRVQPPRVIPTPQDVVVPPPLPQTAAPVEQPVTTQTPVETVSEPSASAAYLNNPKPDYPEMAERMRWEGTVWLRVHVLENGHPDIVEVQKSSGRSVLDQAAVKTVRGRWAFVPAKHGQTAVEGWVSVPIEFKLGR
jgi:protein TonB